MKKLLIAAMVGLLTFGSLGLDSAMAQGRGGFMGFIAGCCFGPRAAMDYNDGKEVHFREWLRLIPYVGLVFSVWDGVDGASGYTRTEWADRYGKMFY